MEKRRTGIDRRKNSTTVTGNNRTGTDRRVTVKNYYRFIKILEKILVFNELSVDQFQKILNICSKRICKKDETLCMAGEKGHEMYILIEGELKIVFPDGKEISRIQPVGIVGEMGIFTEESRSASVIAHADSILLTITKNELMRLFQKDCFLAVRILMNVTKDLSQKLRKNNVIIDEMRQICMPGEFTKILSKIVWESEEK